MTTAIEHDFPFTARPDVGAPVERGWDDTRPLEGIVPHRSPDFLSGTSIKLGRRRGGGGSGVVHRSTDYATGRTLAVKILREDRLENREGFLREASILRRVDSPWVVRFCCSGALPDGRPWFAMEYLEGQSLSRVLRHRQSIDLPQVIEWLHQACLGLAAVHDQGWAHRDVKPSNFMFIDEPGAQRLVVVDLGIAACFGVRPSLLSGTPEYIAPEQAQGKPVDLRSDVYALGCCAYELLTGRPIVSESGRLAKLNAHIEGVSPVWPDPDAVPYVLRRVVERCLARAPDARPPNMHAVDAELSRASREIERRLQPSLPVPTPIVCDVTTVVRPPVAAANDEPLPSRDREIESSLRGHGLCRAVGEQGRHRVAPAWR